MTPDSPLLTTEEVAGLTRLSPNTVRRLAASGRIQSMRVPGTREYRFPREQFAEFLAVVAADAASSPPSPPPS